MNKVCLIIPFFGKWPIYFPLFLRSVSSVEIIDVLFFTDLPYDLDIPKNVRVINGSLHDFNEMATVSIGREINVREPYKLCDFKPAYGKIFGDYIQGYSHWAFGDIDVLYGRVAKLLPHDWWMYDVLTFRKEWLSGSLTILRNNSEINSLFTMSSSYQECFRKDDNSGFDECWNLYHVLQGKGPDEIFSVDNRQSFTWIIATYRNEGKLRVFQEKLIKESIPAGDCVFYNDGKVIDRIGKEYIFYHYITEKRTSRFSFLSCENIPEQFVITRYGFLKKDEYQTILHYLKVLRGEFANAMAIVMKICVKSVKIIKRVFI